MDTLTHIDNFQFPQVLDTVQIAIATGQEVLQVLLQAQDVQPGGQRTAAITAQSLHLQGETPSLTDGLQG